MIISFQSRFKYLGFWGFGVCEIDQAISVDLLKILE